MKEILDKIKQHWKILLAIGLVLIVVGSVGAFFFVRHNKNRLVKNKPASTAPVEETANLPKVSLVTIEGKVEVKPRGKAEWIAATANQEVIVESSIKTSEASNTVVRFPDESLLVVDASSEITLKKISDTEITVEQNYGKTYSKVEKKEGRTFSITKNNTKVTALGTEFLIDIAKDTGMFNLLVFQSMVTIQHGIDKNEVGVQNKISLNLSASGYTSSMVTDSEKEMNKPYLALLEKAKQVVVVAQQKAAEAAAAAKSEAQKASGTAGSTGGATGGSTGGSGSSGGSGSNGGSGGTGNNNPPPSSNIYGHYSNTSVESIANSLQLAYNDNTGDWNNPGGGHPPSGVYHYSPIDLDNLYMGISGGRLYLKWTLGGAIPTSLQTTDGNTISTLVYNVGLDTDNNANTGMFGSETFLQINIAYHDGQIWYNPWFNAGYISGEGDGAVFAKTGNGLAHTYNSGIGKQSIVYSYALSDLNNTVNVGNNLRLNIWSEAESNLWHHYSFDGNSDSIPWTAN